MLFLLWQTLRFLLRLASVLVMVIVWLGISVLLHWKAFSWMNASLRRQTWDFVFKGERNGPFWRDCPWH